MIGWDLELIVQSGGNKSSATAFAPFGGVFERVARNLGCRSLRSIALGWELVAPSGRTLNAGTGRGGGNWDYAMPSGRALTQEGKAEMGYEKFAMPSEGALNAGGEGGG